MNKEQPNYYGIIPASVRYNTNLTANAKLLYSELTALCSKEGFCWARNKYFAELYNVAPETVSVWVSSLIEEGYIQTESTVTKIGKGRKIHLNESIKNPIKKNLKMPLKKNLKYINNTRDSNTSINKLSKDNMDSGESNPIIFKSKFVKKVVCHWNDIEYTSNIKTRITSKTIDKIDEYLKQLRNGLFLQKNLLTPLCRRRNNVPENKQYSRQEIMKGIDNLALFFKGEYEPADKTCLPKGLLSLIYNPIGKTSWLMQAIHNPPKLISSNIRVKDNYPNVTRFFADRMNGHVETAELRTKLVYGIRSVAEFQKRIPAKTLNEPKLNREFGNLLSLCKNYWDWLDNQDWLDEITPASIGTKGKLWAMFVKEMEEDCDGYRLQ